MCGSVWRDTWARVMCQEARRCHWPIDQTRRIVAVQRERMYVKPVKLDRIVRICGALYQIWARLL